MATPSRTPRYVQIATYLRILIQRNQLKKGSQLPTEMELCKRFKCSRSTVRQALDALVRDGDVRRVRGAGTFVSDQAIMKSSRLLVAVLPNVTNSELARFVQLLGLVAIEKGYTLLLGVTNDMPEIERQFLDEVARLRVSGVLKFPTNIEWEEETRARFREYGLPYVIVNDFWTGCRQDSHVAYDEVAAVEMAVDHLAELGHRRMVFVDGIVWPRSKAVDAFLRCLARRGLPHEQNQVLLYDVGHESPAVERLYDEAGPNPTALVTAYGVVATQTLVQLRKFEMRIPEDVSVVNINGRPIEEPLGMDLTTAVPPNREIIDRALQMLTVGHAESHVRHYLYKPSFHVGRTSGPCREVAAEQDRRESVRVRSETEARKEVMR